MTNRRHFLGSFLTSVGAGMAVLSPTLGAAVFRSHDGVPPRLDCRTDIGACIAPIRVYRNGKEVEHVVAYDLDAQTVTRYRMQPDGKIFLAGSESDYIVDRGAVVVRWDYSRMASS